MRSDLADSMSNADLVAWGQVHGFGQRTHLMFHQPGLTLWWLNHRWAFPDRNPMPHVHLFCHGGATNE